MNEPPKIALTEIKIKKEYEEALPRHDPIDHQRLKNDIILNGFRETFKLGKDGFLLDGHERYYIAKELGVHAVPYEFKFFDSPLEEFHYVLSCNVSRRNLNIWQKGKLALKLEDIEAKLAEQRQKAGTLLPIGSKGTSAKKASDVTGIGERTFYKIKSIQKKAPKHIIEKLDRGSLSVDSAYNQIVIKENKKLPNLPLPPGQYNLVIWDPSWPFDNKVAGGSGTSGNAQKYRPETIEELKSRGLQNILAKDAILGIWTLPTFHSEVLEVIQSNGFEKIKTKIYWDKMASTMGFNFRNSVEELCICVRGKVKAFWQTNQPNIIHQKSQRPHSRKPDIFFEIMEKAARVGLQGYKLNKLEINATKPRDGWVTIGNQLEVLA